MGPATDEPEWDVFVSYARADRAPVEGLIAALREEGLRVFVDDPGVPAFTSITAQIRTAMASSRLLLAYFSQAYLTRLACRWELDYAIRAGYGQGDPFARVAVVNPEPGMIHIPYPELRSTKVWPEPRDANERRGLIRALAAQLDALPGPIGDLTPSARFPSPPGFCGRDLEIHEINALIGIGSAARADAMGRSPRRRTALLVGAAGTGKSALIAEYLHRFGEQFPRVRHMDAGRLDAHPDGLAVIEDLGEDDLPAVRSWLAAMPPACAALLTSRAHLHLPADPIRLDGIDPAGAAAVLNAYRAPGPGEDGDALALAAASGGHPQTVHLLGHLLQTRGDRPYAAALREWHRRDGDALADLARAMVTLQDGYPADVPSAIAAAFPPEGSAAWTALRALTARPGLTAHPALLAEVLAADGHPERLGTVLDELRRRALLETRPPERPSPIVARIAERHDPDPVARSAVASLVDAAYDRHLHTGRQRGRGMSEATTAVAFTLQIELSTRIATRPLPEGQGLLSEALGSLKALFDAARTAVKELGSANRDGEVALLAGKLCETLRPFLTEWHPRLDDHLSTRPPGVGVLTHERAWGDAAALRAELPGLQATLTEVLDRLRQITGSDL